MEENKEKGIKEDKGKKMEDRGEGRREKKAEIEYLL